MTLFSLKFWLGLSFVIHFLLFFSVWSLVRRLRRIGVGASVDKAQVKSIAASVYQETLEKLEACTDNLADKAAVQMVDRAAQDILDLLDPLVKGSETTAAAFDGQIKEKQRLIRELNEALDSRIISINLLISRAESLLDSSSHPAGHLSRSPSHNINAHRMGGRNINFSGLNDLSDYKERDAILRGNGELNVDSREDILDQQQRILDLYEKGLDASEIAERVAMPRGEVQLVIDLKEKFLKMENRF